MTQTDSNSSQELLNKEPWLAVNLSVLFPGLGQIYAGKYLLGTFWIVATLTCIALVIFTKFVIVSFISFVLIRILDFFDAYRSAKNCNSPDFEALRKSRIDPWLAVFLTRIIPGVGHIYAKKNFTGYFLLTIWLISSSFVPLLSLLILLISPLIMYHVYVSSRAVKSHKKTIIFFCILSVILPLIIAFSIRTFVAEARYIPASSMEPTLQINDRLMIDKLSYQFQPPERGDLIVFNPTKALEAQNFHDAFIKRIIGLPGEKVEIKQGKVYVNSKALKEKYIAEAPNYEYGPVTVPSNSYFVLGDNRNNSYDSHYWGFVPKEKIIGKATKIFWPLERAKNIINEVE